MDPTLEQITHTLRQLQAEFEDLAVAGLRAGGPDRLAVLKSLCEHLQRVGAQHLSSRLEILIEAVANDRADAAAALMRAQASVRLFERVLTRDAMIASLAGELEDEQEVD